MMKTSEKRQLHYGPLRLARGILAHGSFVVVSFLALLIVQSCAGNHVDSTPEDSLAADGAPGGRSDGGTDSGRVGETDTGPGIEPVEIPDLYVLSKGLVHEVWGGSAQLSAFDSNSSTPYGDCTDEVAGTETCPSIDWEVVPDPERDNVLEVRYLSNAGHAGIVVGPAPPVELSAFSGGSLSLDIKVIDAEATAHPDIAELATFRLRQLDLARTLNATRKDIVSAKARIDRSRSELATQQAILDESPDYVLRGKLTISPVFDGVKRPIFYRLQDPFSGRSLAYISPESEVDVRGMLGQRVGIVGRLEWNSQWQVTTVEPERVDLVSVTPAQ